VKLSAVQSSILLAIGLQRKSIEDVEVELQVPVSQGLALFVKLVKKITNSLIEIQKAAVGAGIPDVSTKNHNLNLDSASTTTGGKSAATVIAKELDKAGDEATKALREKQREMINSLDLRKYAIDDQSVDWASAGPQVENLLKGAGNPATIVSVKSAAGSSLKRKSDGDGKNERGGKAKKMTRRGSGKKSKQ